MDSSIVWHAMQMDMYYWKICGSGGMSIMRISVMGGHVHPVGRHVLEICAEAATIEAAVTLGSRCVFFSQ